MRVEWKGGGGREEEMYMYFFNKYAFLKKFTTK